MNRSVKIAKNLIQTYRAMSVQSRFTFATREEEWLDKRTKSNEKVYFDQEDRKAMKRLLEKLNTTSKFVEDSEYLVPQNREVENILKRYHINYTQALVDELVDWKLGKN
ncbi:hypothetical protein ABPG72_000095 [Tetrahymena utriculariae]